MKESLPKVLGNISSNQYTKELQIKNNINSDIENSKILTNISFTNESEFFQGEYSNKEYISIPKGINISKADEPTFYIDSNGKLNLNVTTTRVYAYVTLLASINKDMNKETIESIINRLNEKNGNQLNKTIVNRMIDNISNKLESNTVIKNINKEVKVLINPNLVSFSNKSKRHSIRAKVAGETKRNKTNKQLIEIVSNWDINTKLTKKAIGEYGRANKIAGISVRNVLMVDYRELTNQLIKEFKDTKTIDLNNYKEYLTEEEINIQSEELTKFIKPIKDIEISNPTFEEVEIISNKEYNLKQIDLKDFKSKTKQYTEYEEIIEHKPLNEQIEPIINQEQIKEMTNEEFVTTYAKELEEAFEEYSKTPTLSLRFNLLTLSSIPDKTNYLNIRLNKNKQNIIELIIKQRNEQ